ncbi:hypothetical protein AAFF_G00072020 [Aldrovandia affinis]|uniref:Uncharacterized protein n=1 Tax=Aldrovandia affinis TaxID=143900 RepID=A0AAD7RYT2_9TELE|nr:hypothetical protein AAFF_G00072020 [Aldrovandia affinis]
MLGEGLPSPALEPFQEGTQVLCLVRGERRDRHVGVSGHAFCLTLSLMCEQTIIKMSTNACHPFLVNTFTSFQTQLHACFVMEYAGRGGLLTHSKGRSFTEPRAM